MAMGIMRPFTDRWQSGSTRIKTAFLSSKTYGDGGLKNYVHGLLYIQDRDEFTEKYLGVTFEQYKGWVYSIGTPQCGERSSKGTRCRNMVNGGSLRSILDWVKLDGGVCAVHGGERSDHT